MNTLDILSYISAHKKHFVSNMIPIQSAKKSHIDAANSNANMVGKFLASFQKPLAGN